MIANNIGVITSIGVNYVYDEQNGSQLIQEVDGLYYNVRIGVQFYFGNRINSKPKISKETKPLDENLLFISIRLVKSNTKINS